MADAEMLFGQLAFVFITSVFPYALVGLFPLWLALRRGRLAIVLGVLAGVLVAAAWSFALLRRAA